MISLSHSGFSSLVYPTNLASTIGGADYAHENSEENTELLISWNLKYREYREKRGT
jgi:hypothetical protein